VNHGSNGFEVNPLDENEITNRLREMANMDSTRRKMMGDSNAKIIEQWSPKRFSDGLLAAVEIATGTSAKGK